MDAIDDSLVEDDGQVSDADWSEVNQVVWDDWALEVEGVSAIEDKRRR